MKIPKKHKKFFTACLAKKTFTIKDAQTKLYLYPQNNMNLVKVDKGVIIDKSKKCDYLTYSNSCSNFIELKGTVIAKAYEQIESTITYLQGNDTYNKLLDNEKVKAIIASPIRQKIPQGVESKKRSLAKKIANLNQTKVENIYSFITHIIVKPKIKKVITHGEIVYCSEKAPFHIE